MNPAGPNLLESMLPFVVIIGLMYFVMIRPQAKKMKEQDGFLKNLKRGDAVVTTSGILGTIDGMTDSVVTLEVANGVKLKMLRKQVAASQASLEKTPAADKKS